ncbi:MAG TPA: amino acid ABC transporter permease [Candidatus Dormibacteraeota bacterium]|nr:amino acid ABC transporter permease [Candidatus Dormibacteraeota bacterium]
MTSFDVHIIVRSLPFLWKGMQLSIALAVYSAVVGISMGVVLAIMRLSSIRPLAWLSYVYVNLLRSVPLLLILLWFYLLVPLLTGHPVGAFSSALIAFAMFEAAYYAEIIRAGIESIPARQSQAALSTGLTRWQAMRHVVLPQAFANMTPSLLAQGILLFMDTSLVVVVGLRDFMATASIIATQQARVVELYTFVALVYFVICFAASRAVGLLRRRVSAA